MSEGVIELAREQIRLHELNRDGVSGRVEPVAVTLARHLLEQPERAAMHQRLSDVLDALVLARKFIAHEQIEHAVVDVARPNVGLGQHLDAVITDRRSEVRPFGACLASAVLQSDLYRMLDPEAKAECDELIERWREWLKPRGVRRG